MIGAKYDTEAEGLWISLRTFVLKNQMGTVTSRLNPTVYRLADVAGPTNFVSGRAAAGSGHLKGESRLGWSCKFEPCRPDQNIPVEIDSDGDDLLGKSFPCYKRPPLVRSWSHQRPCDSLCPWFVSGRYNRLRRQGDEGSIHPLQDYSFHKGKRVCGVGDPLRWGMVQTNMFGSSMKFMNGRRVFYSASKPKGWPMVERIEVRMLARVTTMRVRSPHAERPRFPLQW